jgi:hypothetical protein
MDVHLSRSCKDTHEPKLRPRRQYRRWTVSDQDFFLAARREPVRAARAVEGAVSSGNGSTGTANGVITAVDSSRSRYASWLRSLAQDLLDTIGDDRVDHVFFFPEARWS